MTSVVRTNSGVYIRGEPDLGILTFSPHTGLLLGVHRSYAGDLLPWLDQQVGASVAEDVRSALGHGWTSEPLSLCVPVPHLLPASADWQHVSSPREPLLINWFITGQCPLNCVYCYAEDMMRGRKPEPTPDDIQERAARLLGLSPLVVVLTGGDPLFGGNFRFAVEALAGKAGILVDTSGYTLNDQHIETMLHHRVCARISIDAERPRVHNRLRPVYPGYPQLKAKLGESFSRAFFAIIRLRDAGIPVSVQTVATKKNVSELLAFGDKLVDLGVVQWRILKVAPSNAKMAAYRSLSGMEKDSGESVSKRAAPDLFRHHFAEIAAAARARWAGRMNVQITANESPNAIIMLEPGGTFVTESNVPGGGKILIDPEFPEMPRLEALPRTVNMAAHVERYLNLTSRRYW